MQRAFALSVLLLAGCNSQPVETNDAKRTDVPKSVVQAPSNAGAPVENKYGTAVKDRVATIGLLNKRNNLTQDLVMKSGESRRFGNVVVKVETCEKTLPWENPPETGAFLQVFVEERATANANLAWRTVFSGWLFKESPSLNVVEHPVYDVWVKDCAMKFPGEEETPPSAAASSSAAKPSGSESVAAKPKPSASPSAKPSPKPSPKPSEAAE
jgi:hypothetical protein